MAKICAGCSKKLKDAKSNPDIFRELKWWHNNCYEFQQRMKTHGNAFRTKKG